MSNVIVHQVTGSSNEYFLSLEAREQGMREGISRAIVVPAGMHHISMFLTEISGDKLMVPSDAFGKLIDPEGNVYGVGLVQPSKGDDPNSAVMSLKTDIGQMIYVPNPMEGVWGLELEIEEHGHFSCEVRVLPATGADSDGILSRSMVEFGQNLPETKLVALLKKWQGAVAGDDPCIACQAAVVIVIIAFGLTALIFAALLEIFFPVATVISTALALIGGGLALDVIVGVLGNLRDAILGRPQEGLTKLSGDLCRLTGACG